MNESYCLNCMSPIDNQQVCPVCGTPVGSLDGFDLQPHYLTPGTILHGRYLLGRVLGAGGFGITYIGMDLVLKLKVAVKEYFLMNHVSRTTSTGMQVFSYPGTYAHSFQEGKLRFLEEARVLAKMDKLEAIVGVKDFFEENNTAYIVMEYIEGTTLANLVRQNHGRISPEQLLPLMKPLFEALSSLHLEGLIHRDISPDNIMLENNKVRLLDFGCAREATTGSERITIMLKPGFAPLEQYEMNGQGAWTDVYALCATLYYCLTGQTPPLSTQRLQNDSLIPPSEMGVAISPQLEKALLKGMAVKPQDRFQSVEELSQAIFGGSGAPSVRDDQTTFPGHTEMPHSGDIKELSGTSKETQPGQTVHSTKKNTAEDGKSLQIPRVAVAALAVILLLCVSIGIGTKLFHPSKPTSETTVVTENTDTTKHSSGNETTTTPPNLSGVIDGLAEKDEGGDHTPAEQTPIITSPEETSKPVQSEKTTASGFEALPLSAIEQLPEIIECGTWKTSRKVQGMEWNTSTMNTIYVCYDSCIVGYDTNGKVKCQSADVEDAHMFSIDYYEDRVISVMRSSSFGKIKLRVYDAETLELINSVDLNDIMDQFSADKDDFGEGVVPFIGGVMVAPTIGSQSGEKLYICYNSYIKGEEDHLVNHDRQKIYEYDYRKTIKAKKRTQAKRVLTADLGVLEQGIQTLEYDRSSGNVWCGVRKGLTSYSLYCLDGRSKKKKLSLVDNGDSDGWKCPDAKNGMCSLGNDWYYLLKPKYRGDKVTVVLKKVSLKNLEADD